MDTGPRADLVVFDFDGTLCDSADIKTDAFYRLYLDEQGEEFARRVEKYHLVNAGLPRHDKILHIESEMIGVPPSPQRMAAVTTRFSTLVEDAVVAAPLFPGVLAFLDRFAGAVPLAIASATPTEELRRIVDRKGIDRYFDAIEGSPQSKAEIIDGFAAAYSVPHRRIVMVGDQPSDAAAAREASCLGIMLSAADEGWAKPFPVARSFAEASALISAMLQRSS